MTKTHYYTLSSKQDSVEEQLKDDTTFTRKVVLELIEDVKKTNSLLMIVNERKVLLQQVNKNLFLELRNYTQATVEYLDLIKPGVFTNYNSSHFVEPECILMILTKKHNVRELRLLEELKKRNFKVYVIALGTDYYYSKFNIIVLDKIKTLYSFMYALFNLRNSYTYTEFSKFFKFEVQKYDFKKFDRVQEPS